MPSILLWGIIPDAHCPCEVRALIHVVLPTYQPDQNWLTAQIQSILNQSGVSVRLWLCPDGSPETITAVVEAFADARVSVLSFEERIGLLANVERGLEAALAEAASDDVFAFADQDDIWHSTKLAKSLAALPPGLIAAATHDARVVNSTGLLIAPSLHAYERRHSDLDQLALLIANTVSGMSMLMTREAVVRSLPFPKHIPEMLHDWWIALVVSGAGSIKRLDEALLDYRQHQANRVGAKRVDTFSHFTLRPRRSFLGKQYREMARRTFELRRQIATELNKRDALSPAAASLFLNRKLRLLLRPWSGGAAKYAVRCWIGMVLGSKGARFDAN